MDGFCLMVACVCVRRMCACKNVRARHIVSRLGEKERERERESEKEERRKNTYICTKEREKNISEDWPQIIFRSCSHLSVRRVVFYSIFDVNVLCQSIVSSCFVCKWWVGCQVNKSFLLLY